MNRRLCTLATSFMHRHLMDTEYYVLSPRRQSNITGPASAGILLVICHHGCGMLLIAGGITLVTSGITGIWIEVHTPKMLSIMAFNQNEIGVLLDRVNPHNTPIIVFFKTHAHYEMVTLSSSNMFAKSFICSVDTPNERTV